MSSSGGIVLKMSLWVKMVFRGVLVFSVSSVVDIDNSI